MGIVDVQKGFLILVVLTSVWLTGCQTSTTPGSSASTANAVNKSLAPERVDIRGNIIVRRYNQGQVMLEVEGMTSPNSRYQRAYVLVLPSTQIFDTNGQTISLSELSQGQDVAVLLRGGGKGNFVGMGVARKLWVEDNF